MIFSFLSALACVWVPVALIALVVVWVAYRSTHPETLAVLALVLGILGLIFVLPLAGSIAAIWVGNLAVKRSQAAAVPLTQSQDGLARAGILLGWIGIGLAGLAIIGALLFLMPAVVTPLISR